MKAKLSAVMILLSLLINVNAGAPVLAIEKAVALKSGDKTPPVQYETRVYVRRQCLITEAKDNSDTGNERKEFFGLGAIFLPLLIKKALGGASSALKKAGSAQTLKDTGRVPIHLFQISKKVTPQAGKEPKIEKTIALNPDLGCILIVRGTFDGPDPLDQSEVNYSGGKGILSGENNENGRITRLKNSNIPVSEVAFLYEAAIRISDDKTALYYDTRFLAVNTFQGSRSSDSRGLVISITISGVSAKEGEPVLSLAMINLGQVRRGVAGSSRRSGWLGGLGISDEATKVVEALNLEDNMTIGLMPITIEATIAETDDGNKALLFIAEVLDATKEDVSKTVSGEILKDREKEAETKAKESANAIEKLRQEEETAYPEYLKAIAEVKTLGVTYPVPDGTNLTLDQEIKIAEADKTRRIWCGKFNALSAMGISVSRLRSSDCQ